MAGHSKIEWTEASSAVQALHRFPKRIAFAKATRTQLPTVSSHSDCSKHSDIYLTLQAKKEHCLSPLYAQVRQELARCLCCEATVNTPRPHILPMLTLAISKMHRTTKHLGEQARDLRRDLSETNSADKARERAGLALHQPPLHTEVTVRINSTSQICKRLFHVDSIPRGT